MKRKRRMLVQKFENESHERKNVKPQEDFVNTLKVIFWPDFHVDLLRNIGFNFA